MSRSPTLGAGLENARRFTMKQTAGGIHLHVDGSTARLGYNLRTADVTVHEQLAELMLALLTRFARDNTARKEHLAERELTFKTLVEETRLALAHRYLQDPSLSLTETAHLLGYSDLSAFSRAFRRWTGESAIEFGKRI